MGATPAGEPTGGVGEEDVGISGGVEQDTLLQTGIPAAIEVTSKGLNPSGNSGASRGGGGGLGGGGGGGAEEVLEKRAIAHVFHKVDLDASGHVSKEELLEGVRACFWRWHNMMHFFRVFRVPCAWMGCDARVSRV